MDSEKMVQESEIEIPDYAGYLAVRVK